MEELEAVKARQLSLRERLAARRQQRENLLAGVLAGSRPSAKGPSSTSLVPPTAVQNSSTAQTPGIHETAINKGETKDKSSNGQQSTDCLSSPKEESLEVPVASTTPSQTSSSSAQHSKSVESTDSSAPTPPTSDNVRSKDHSLKTKHPLDTSLPKPSSDSGSARKSHHSSKRERHEADRSSDIITNSSRSEAVSNLENELEHLLGAQTAKEQEIKRIREEILDLLNTPTAKERYLSERFRTQGGSQVQQFCAQGTRIECSRHKARTGDRERCTKLHFRKLIQPHTDESLGDCSFLNTCFHVDTCKYVHYTIDYSDGAASMSRFSAGALRSNTGPSEARPKSDTIDDHSADTTDSNGLQSFPANEPPMTLYPPQWINCDIRQLNMSILGKFAVIMADPPWDIHMELPYGTMSDDEMRRLDIPCLQDDGYLFLWVTGRAMELGRECLRLWGYQRVDEIIWVKTNQLQRLIRTGRTGHWLNHGKEHCLVGLKGNPQGVNRGLDCDVIVSEVRETSHKPDEIYGIIERLSPGTRKLELFGRPHNLQPNWITLGNQLDGTYLVDPTVVERFKKQYPNGLDTVKG